MKRLLRAILVGALLTVLLFALAGFLGGACHCLTPTTLLFPYGALILSRFGLESIGLLTMALQFPFYAIVLAKVNEWERRTVVFVGLFAAHVVAALLCLKLMSP